MGFAFCSQHNSWEIHPCCCIYKLLSFISGVFNGRNVPQFIHCSPIERHLDYFKFLAVTNKAAIDTHAYIFFVCEHESLFLWDKCLGVQWESCRLVSFLICLKKNAEIIFRMALLQSHYQCMRDPIFLQSLCYLLVSLFSTLTTLKVYSNISLWIF